MSAKSTVTLDNTEEKDFGGKTNFPDPIEFINKSYKAFSLLDLQDALIAFSKSSTETKRQIDKIIPKNFAKFINCKGLMEKIKSDYKDQDLLNKNSDRKINVLIEKYEHLVKKHNIKIEEDSAKETVKTLLFSTKELKEILRSNILNFDVFVDILKNENDSMIGYDAFESDEVLEVIRPELKDFVEVVYERMVNQNIEFDETCRLMDIYLYASNFRNNYNDEQKKAKLISTLLVHFKEDTLSKLKVSENYYSYLFKSLNKILEHSDEIQGIEAIHHVFVCLLNVLKGTDVRYSLIVFRRVDDFKKSFNGRLCYIQELKLECSDLRINIFKHFIASVDIPETLNIFGLFLTVFREHETGKAQEIITEKVAKHLMNSTLCGFDYIDEHDRCIDIISLSLGHKECKSIKNLEKRVSERKNSEIQGIAKDFLFMFTGKNDDIEILMEATKIVEKGKSHTFIIFFECKEKIVKNSIVLYYLHRYLKMDQPVLKKEKKETAEFLKAQFCHLLQ